MRVTEIDEEEAILDSIGSAVACNATARIASSDFPCTGRGSTSAYFLMYLDKELFESIQKAAPVTLPPQLLVLYLYLYFYLCRSLTCMCFYSWS
jgi:hypothetical protein